MSSRLVKPLLFGVLLVSAPAFAAVITVDELGHGLPFRIGNDPGPGGLNNVLIYTLPFAGVQGDVLVSNPQEGLGDLIRFNGDSTMIIYSDNIGGIDSLADTPNPPQAFYGNQAMATEIGPEGLNSVTYTPTANQPGFAASAPTYVLVSDGQIPEPATLSLVAFGLAWTAARARMNRSRRRSL